jgi:hypothetical protein
MKSFNHGVTQSYAESHGVAPILPREKGLGDEVNSIVLL